MKKKLVKHGNSFALIIENPILRLFHIEPAKDVLLISTDAFGIRIETLLNAKRRIIVEAARLDRIENREFYKLMRKVQHVVESKRGRPKKVVA